MRFSDEYRRLQAPQWASRYITYDRFKTAIKVEHGLAQKENRGSNFSSILTDLEDQCQRVERLYQAEYSRWCQILNQIGDAQEVFGLDTVPRSQPILSARKQLLRQAVVYASGPAKALMLFRKTNTDAARRISEKLNRTYSIEGRNERFDLPKCDFFDRPNASYTYDFYETLAIYDSVDDTRNVAINNIDSEDLNTIVEPFLSRVQTDSGMRGWQKQKLSFIIELLSFYRRSCGVALDSSITNASAVTASNVLDNMLRSTIATQIADMDPLLLFQTDEFGRTPLHHAAEHGLDDIISAFREHSKVSSSVLDSFTKPFEPDMCQNSPLLLAICSGNKLGVDNMLLLFREHLGQGNTVTLPTYLARTALQAGNLDIFEAILNFGVNINETDDLGQSLICTAVSHMPSACPIILKHGANIDLVEPASGRTAICLACIRGDIPSVQLFLEHHADHTIRDSRQWLPIEHAAYRGHLKITKLLASLNEFNASAHMSQAGPLITSPLIQTDRTNSSPIPWIHEHQNNFKGYYVWIRLGNNDAKRPVKGLQLEGCSPMYDGSHYTNETLYSLSVSVCGERNITNEWTLPILESTMNKPWLFEIENIEDLKLEWRLSSYTVDNPDSKGLVATGVALMGTLNTGSRQNRESVVRSSTIPLLSTEPSSYAGSITFTYFWSKPHPPPERLQYPHFWQFGNGIGGHRGSGKNVIDDKKLQIGENTAQSFSTAISHGASFLEFDVQLTKDLVPVVYHDFLISETGTDSTMHTLTYDQFKTLSSVQGPRRNAKSRSNSLQQTDYGYLDTFRERMGHTHFNKINGFKANTRGNFIHEQACSLDEIFRHLPASIPLNIELKYPMLFETEEWDMELLAIKTDIFVDTILDKVYEHAEGRKIVFSSFNPEICIALSTKQRSFPVFFLSKTSAPRGEVRSSCIQQAVHFAKTWGLPGIVTECTPFIHCPRLIEYVKSAGLAVTSFGGGNSDKKNVKAQFDGGINAVISDSIRAIKELREIAEGEDGPDPVRVYP